MLVSVAAHRVEPREEQQEADVEDVLAREAIAVDLGLQEARDDVVGQARRSLIDETAEVLVDPFAVRVGDRAASPCRTSRLRVEPLGMEHAVAHVEEPCEAPSFRQPHQPEENRRREQVCEIFGEVALTTVDELVDEIVHSAGDVRLLLVHPLRREERVEELAVLRRCIGGSTLSGIIGRTLPRARVDVRGELLGVAQQVLGVHPGEAAPGPRHRLVPTLRDQVDEVLLRRGEVEELEHRHGGPPRRGPAAPSARPILAGSLRCRRFTPTG